MTRSSYLGEFEQLVLLAVLQLDEQAHGMEIRAEIERHAERRVTRGALYTTLERLESKGFLDWKVEDSTPARGGLPRRCFHVTPAGLDALRASRRAVANLSRGLGRALSES